MESEPSGDAVEQVAEFDENAIYQQKWLPVELVGIIYREPDVALASVKERATTSPIYIELVIALSETNKP